MHDKNVFIEHDAGKGTVRAGQNFDRRDSASAHVPLRALMRPEREERKTPEMEA